MRVGPDLAAAAVAVDLAGAVVDEGVRHLATTGDVEIDQVVAYDLAHSAAAIENARSVLDYGSLGEAEARIACAFVADAVHGVATRTLWREAVVGDPAGRAGRCRGLRAGLIAPPNTWPSCAASRARVTWTATSSWCRTPFAASLKTRSVRWPRRSTAATSTFPSASSGAWPSSARSGCRYRRSTAGLPPAERASTSRWSWPRRSCREARSASPGASSPGPRSSPGRCSPAGPKSRSTIGCLGWLRGRSWTRSR